MNTLLINGKPDGRIPVNDRGLCYGDGVFETMAVVRGRVRFGKDHMRRLDRGCRRLGIRPPDRVCLESEIHSLIQCLDRAVLKLVVTRGAGGRGYCPAPDMQPNRILSVHDWPEYPRDHYRKGVRIRICDARLASNSALAGIKHLNRLEQVMARREWSDDSIAEGIMLDGQGNVICGTMSNVFVVRERRMTTPALTRSGVRGVMRENIMRLARERGIVPQERDLDLAQLLEADEVFLTNALIGIWPVVKLDKHVFERGAISRFLMDGLAELGVAECAVT